ncbi:MAG: hypothetical protein E4G99_06970 [Anaerolineales bacterium]|nr:MAG: hypothetical protein E4G99_06970 [Anaerolineales bacterium]
MAWPMKRPALLAISLAFLVSAVISPEGLAQTFEINIPTEVEFQFGSQLSFTGFPDSTDTISRAVVFMRPSRGGETLVLEASIIEDTTNPRLKAALDLRPSPIQPFELFTFWWQVDFTSGANASSPAQEFRYEDNRFAWKQLSEDRVTISWVEGDVDRGRDVLLLTQDALDGLRQSLGFMAPEKVAVYLYPSAADLQSGMQIGGAPWIGAHTVPELGVVLLAVPNTTEAFITIERDLPHELTHLLLYDRMGESYRNLPAWLSEGLATLQERQANPAYRFELEQAVEADALLDTESLCAAFPVSDGDALLAYAQSASFTQYLLDIYGMGGVLRLLDAYQEGTTCTGGIQRVYQRPLSQLESEWKRVSLHSPTTWQRFAPILPWGLLILPIILLLIIGFSARKKTTPPSQD